MSGLVSPVRAAVSLAAIAALATIAIAVMHVFTRDDIAAAEHLAQQRALAIVLPMDRYDNDPLVDQVHVQASAWTGSPDPILVRRARRGHADAALVLDVVANDGYAGPIRLLIGIDANGRVTGVRVTGHRETPGLGDAIEAGKSHWIERFTGKSLDMPPPDRWAVKRDGGDFDQFAGATITPRAVVAAVERSLQLVARHGAEIYAAPIDANLRFDDAPEKGEPR